MAVETLGEKIEPNTLVIVETTVPPGTCENLVLPTLRRKFRERGFDEQSVRLAHSYERVMPGEKYLDSIINYWRVFAAVDEASSAECETFLSKVINTEDYPLRKLSSMTASETAKIVENTYRAINNIALVDEWSQFAEIANINLNEVWLPSETDRHIQIFVSLGLALGDIALPKILCLGLLVKTNSSVISRPTSHLQIWPFNVIGKCLSAT